MSDRWDVMHAIENAWEATSDGAGTYEARLARTLDKHAGSRTIHAQMLRDVAELALGRVAELEATHAVALDARRAVHTAELARLEKSRDEWREMCLSAQKHLDERRTIREERDQAAGAEDCQVTIANGYVGWTVAGLEEVAYRLRTGGAEDDTPVEVDRSRAVAMVPAPNLVQLDASTKAKSRLADIQDQPRAVASVGFLERHWLPATALSWLALVVVVLVAVLR